MQIVLGLLALEGPGGTQSYALTVASHLERLGHDAVLTSGSCGDQAALARERGLTVVEGTTSLPDRCDAVLALDAVSALELMAHYPRTPVTVVVHSAELDVHLPPPGTAAAVVLNDAVDRRVRAMAAPPPVHRLHQPVDTDRLFGGGRLPARPGRVLFLGNALHGEWLDRLTTVCDRSGLTWRHLGAHGQLVDDPIGAILEADVVVGQGRSALDAMACGRAVWIQGNVGGDGWVEPASYPDLEADGFRGRAHPVVMDAAAFSRGLTGYRPAMGADNRALVLAHHSAYEHAAALVEVLVAVRAGAPAGMSAVTVGRPAPSTAPVSPRDLARAVRTQHDAQMGMWNLAKEVRDVRDALQNVGIEREDLRVALDEARTDLQKARAERDASRIDVRTATGEGTGDRHGRAPESPSSSRPQPRPQHQSTPVSHSAGPPGPPERRRRTLLARVVRSVDRRRPQPRVEPSTGHE